MATNPVNDYARAFEPYFESLLKRPEYEACRQHGGPTAVNQISKLDVYSGGIHLMGEGDGASILLAEVDAIEDADDVPAIPLEPDPKKGPRQEDVLQDRRLVRWHSPMRGALMGVSIQDVARVFVSPLVVDSMSDRTRGLSHPFGLSLAPVSDSFCERVSQLVAPMSQESRGATTTRVIDCYSRFCNWLLKLPLPAVYDVLTWCPSNPLSAEEAAVRPGYSAEDANRAVAIMSPMDFYACMARMRILLSTATTRAASAFVRHYATVCDALVHDERLRERLEMTLVRVAEKYIRFRYTNVLLLAEARTAVCAYLTCTERVIYSGVIPAQKLPIERHGKGNPPPVVKLGTRTNATDHLINYDGISQAQQFNYAYIHLLASALIRSNLYADGLSLATDNALSKGIRTATAAVAVCFIWRWYSLVHCLPPLMDPQKFGRALVTNTLDPFLSPQAPCAHYTTNPPTINQIISAYLRVSLSREGVSPAAPYLVIPPAAVPAQVCFTTSIDGERLPASKLVTRHRTRHQEVVGAIKQAEKTGVWPMSKHGRNTLAPAHRAWGREYQMMTVKKIFANTQVVETVPSVNTTIPVPLGLERAELPRLSLHRPTAYTRLEETDENVQHFKRLLDEHGEIVPAGLDGGLRIGQFVGTVCYWANHCQSVEPGIVVRKTVRRKLAASVASLLKDAPHASRRRVVKLRDESPLAPLGAVLRKRKADELVFDHETTALHQ